MKQNIHDKNFLCDDLFIYWRTQPTKELTAFWSKFIRENEHLREPFQEAISEFDKIRQGQCTYRLEKKTVYRELQGRLGQARRRRLRILYASSVAAILFLVLITVLYTTRREEIVPGKQMAFIGEVMNRDKVQLFTEHQVVDLENNATVQFSDKEKALIRDSISQKEIDLKNNRKNRLIVPFGKKSSILLSDGSTVYVNSGTELEFPSAFSSEAREISVKGEIFIEVTKQDHPFIIHTPQSQITVYGTSFNVSSYTDDPSESVVLVNGSVEVKSAGNSLMLKPNQKAEISNGSIRQQQVDVMEFTSWKNGYMLLNKTSLTNVLKKIGRYYNIEFNYDAGLKLHNQTCSGKLFLSDNFEDVLQSFSKMTFLNYNVLNERVIYISKP